MQRRIAAAGADAYIRFTGSQSRVAEIYALSDVVVSSSKKPESFGRAAAEALAMEVPVVATGHGGILDLVIPMVTGQLFAPGDVAGLESALVAFRTSPPQGLREFVRQHFTLEKMVESTLAVYRQFADRA